MNIQEYINGKKEIQKEMLFLLSEEQATKEPNFSKLIQLFQNQKIFEDSNEFKEILYLIESLANNHYRSSNFYNIINQILLLLKNEFPKYLTPSEIFNFFASNNLIILCLLENKVLNMTYYVAESITLYDNDKIFFYNEIKPFLSQKEIDEIEKKIEEYDFDRDPEIFEKNRKKGENESYYCQLIRKDLIDDFIIFVNQTNFSLKSIIKKSIFETNEFLLDNETTLIEYAAFYGSLQIFNYLRLNNVELRPILWLYSIHGRNAEIIHLLEENGVTPPENSYEKCLEEAINCHHNEIAEYIQNRYLKLNETNENETIKTAIISSSNFEYFPNDFSDENAFFDLCKYSYFALVEYMLKNKVFDFDYQKIVKFQGDEKIYTPFCASVKNDNTSIVEYLINLPNIDVNSRSVYIEWSKKEVSSNPLIYAVWNDNIKIIQLLLNHKDILINMKSIDKTYENNGSVYIVEQLPLMEAMFPPNLEIIKLLLSHDQTDINMKCKCYYLSSDDDVNKEELIEYITPLHKAIGNGSIEIVKLFLAHPKFDLNIRSFDQNDTSTNDYDESLLCYTFREKQYEILKLLLQQPKIDVNSNCIVSYDHKSSNEEKTILYMAVEEENKEIVQLLLSQPEINVNCKCLYRNNIGSTLGEIAVLHKAIEKGNKEIVELLLAHPKINVNIISLYKVSEADKVEEEEKTTINCAVEKGDVEIMKILLSSNKIDFNMKYKMFTFTHNLVINVRKTSIEYAIANENVEIFQVLFEYFIKKNNPTNEQLQKITDTAMNEKIKSIILQYIK